MEIKILLMSFCLENVLENTIYQLFYQKNHNSIEKITIYQFRDRPEIMMIFAKECCVNRNLCTGIFRPVNSCCLYACIFMNTQI